MIEEIKINDRYVHDTKVDVGWACTWNVLFVEDFWERTGWQDRFDVFATIFLDVVREGSSFRFVTIGKARNGFSPVRINDDVLTGEQRAGRVNGFVLFNKLRRTDFSAVSEEMILPRTLTMLSFSLAMQTCRETAHLWIFELNRVLTRFVFSRATDVEHLIDDDGRGEILFRFELDLFTAWDRFRSTLLLLLVLDVFELSFPMTFFVCTTGLTKIEFEFWFDELWDDSSWLSEWSKEFCTSNSEWNSLSDLSEFEGDEGSSFTPVG